MLQARWHGVRDGVARLVPGAGIDGFYHFEGEAKKEGNGLRLFADWGLLELFGIEVLEERAGQADGLAS